MIRAVIFDLDNTLIDFRKIKMLSCEAAMDAMISAGLKIERKEGLNMLFGLYAKYGLEYQKIFQVFLKEVNGKLDYRIMAYGIVAYRRVKESLLYSYPKVSSTLDEIRRRNLGLGILSDAPRIQAWIRLAAMSIADKFDAVVTFDDTKRRKPDPKPFLFVLKKFKIRPEEALMVGDSMRRDIRPARKLGMKTALALYGLEKHESGKADFRIKKPEDILKVLD